MVTIIDSPCGFGKTQYCIDLMKSTSNYKRYVYITPFKKEVKRIMENVPNTYTPDTANRQGTKLEGIKILLDKYDKNIASTHALFRKFTPEMAEIIKMQHLTLIMDEVMDVVEEIDNDVFPKDDMDVLLNTYITIDKDTGRVTWIGKDDYNGKFSELKHIVTEGHVFAINNSNDNKSFVYFIWTFPVEIFKAFDNIIICTYMFKAQLQRFYYDLYNVEYNMKSIKNGNLIDYKNEKINKDLIHIYNGQLNSIGHIEGNNCGALSVTWYKNKKDLSLILLQKNIYNFVHNEMKKVLNLYPKSDDILWTTFKVYQDKLKGKGYSKGFVPCNSRATNDYINRHIVIYPINRFFNPYIKRFFLQMNTNITVENEEQYALSEMIQFICRSAIRNNEEIYCYIPSERMRNLLISYIE